MASARLQVDLGAGIVGLDAQADAENDAEAGEAVASLFTIDQGIRNRLDSLVTRTLTERMLAKAPLEGKRLWLDIADTSHFYLAEADLSSDPAADAVWDGVRVTLDANGVPVGAVETSTAFVWDNRTAATWTA